MVQQAQYQTKFNLKIIGLRLITIFFMLSTSCIWHEKDNNALKTPKKIPARYINELNSALSKNQDTIFYQEKPFSGHVIRLFAAGDIAFDIGYYNGLLEGITRKWYPNRQLMEERLYINNRKEGVHKGWWADGKPKFIFEVSNDEYTGFYKEWFSNGQMARWFHYKNGQEEGSEKMWWDNGKIRANYVIISGEKFGLSGQKLCVNKNLKEELK